MQPSQPNLFYINQELKMGRETFAVKDDQQNTVCVAKAKLLAIRQHIDVYRDEAATDLVFSIQQETTMAVSKTYDVIAANGNKMGSFKLEAMQSMMNEHWDILDSNGNTIGSIEQNQTTAMEGKMGAVVGGVLGGLLGGASGSMMGAGDMSALSSVIPQKFTAYINNQPVCSYAEEMNIGIFFKMTIDFSLDTSGAYDRTLGIAASILLASKHMTTN